MAERNNGTLKTIVAISGILLTMGVAYGILITHIADREIHQGQSVKVDRIDDRIELKVSTEIRYLQRDIAEIKALLRIHLQETKHVAPNP